MEGKEGGREARREGVKKGRKKKERRKRKRKKGKGSQPELWRKMDGSGAREYFRLYVSSQSWKLRF